MSVITAKCKLIYYSSGAEETFDFTFNPNNYKLPLAPIRTNTSYYNVPIRAFNEEATIELSNDYAPLAMLTELEEIFMNNTKLMVFTDHLDRSFLVSLNKFEKRNPRKIQGENVYGFTLVFDVVVLN